MSNTQIPNYSSRRPHSEIYQNLDVVEDTSVTYTNTCIIGLTEPKNPYTLSYAIEADGSFTPTSDINRATHYCISNNFSEINAVMKKVSSEEEIEALYGATSLDNPMAYGSYVSLVSAEFKPIYVCSADSTGTSNLNTTISATEPLSAGTIAEQTDISSINITINNPLYITDGSTPHIANSGAAMKLDIAIKGSEGICKNSTSYYSFTSSDGSGDIEYTGGNYSYNYSITAKDSNIYISKKGKIIDYGEAEDKPTIAPEISIDSIVCDNSKSYTFTQSEDVSNVWDAILKVLKNTDRVQYLVPMIDNPADNTDLLAAFKSHVEFCSDFEQQRWRRMYLSTDTSDIYTLEEKKKKVIAASKAMSFDRLINVWCDNPKALIDGVETTIPAKYLAAAVAGLRSAKPVQQGLSTEAVSILSNAPTMYTLFDNTSDGDLDDIASYGTMIIYQEYEEQPVLIRHQLTSDSEDGIMYWEDSVGTNFDDICYAIKNSIKGFIGKRNNTPATLVEIKNRFVDALLSKTNNTEGSLIGPQIVEIVEDSVSVTLDANMKDRVILRAQVILPIPLNTIIVYIQGSVTTA